MEVETMGKAEITNAEKKETEISRGVIRKESEKRDPNLTKEYSGKRVLDPFAQEWAENGGPRNQSSTGKVDQRKKKDGANPAHLTSVEAEDLSKNNFLTHMEIEVKDADENSRSAGEKSLKVGKWKKLARAQKGGTSLLGSVAGIKRCTEDEPTEGDQANNKRQKPTRALINTNWALAHPEATVEVVACSTSDHLPIIVAAQGMWKWQSRNEAKCIYRFEQMWLREDDCEKIVARSWKANTKQERKLEITQKLAFTGQALWKWNITTFRNSQRNIKRKEEQMKILLTTSPTDASEVVSCFWMDRGCKAPLDTGGGKSCFLRLLWIGDIPGLAAVAISLVLPADLVVLRAPVQVFSPCSEYLSSSPLILFSCWSFLAFALSPGGLFPFLVCIDGRLRCRVCKRLGLLWSSQFWPIGSFSFFVLLAFLPSSFDMGFFVHKVQPQIVWSVRPVFGKVFCICDGWRATDTLSSWLLAGSMSLLASQKNLAELRGGCANSVISWLQLVPNVDFHRSSNGSGCKCTSLRANRVLIFKSYAVCFAYSEWGESPPSGWC
ncbi:hypothetical protein U1Q18_005497 [Sarracenia purpurea var. burkii]